MTQHTIENYRHSHPTNFFSSGMIGLFNLVQTVALITPLIAIPHYVSILIVLSIYQLVVREGDGNESRPDTAS